MGDIKAQAVLELMVELGESAVVQVVKLERMLRLSSDPGMVECYLCTLSHPVEQWEENEGACPLCGRTKLKR